MSGIGMCQLLMFTTRGGWQSDNRVSSGLRCSVIYPVVFSHCVALYVHTVDCRWCGQALGLQVSYVCMSSRSPKTST